MRGLQKKKMKKNKLIKKNMHAWRQMVEGHFIFGEYTCEECEDYNMCECNGKGYTTQKECLDCMYEKFLNGERVLIYIND
jgi:hypothetical protein